MMSIEKEYGALKKKYNLPSYKELDEEFELLYFQKIIEIKFVLRFVRRRICDKLNAYISFLQSLLNPNPVSLINLEESKFFDKKDKEVISELIKDMIILERESLLLDLDHSEKADAEFIKKGFENWERIKERIIKLCMKLKEGWQSEVKEEKGEHYFG